MNAIEADEPLPPILPPEASHDEQFPDDMPRKTTVTVQVMIHHKSGIDLHAVESAELPEENFPPDKAASHLLVRAFEKKINPRLPRKESGRKD